MDYKPVIGVKRLPISEGLPLPRYETDGAAGFDLAAAERKIIPPYGIEVIRTGLCFEVPQGYELQIRPRSGKAIKNGISVINSPGTIDCDYRGEILLGLINHTEVSHVVARGDRMAQAVLARVNQAVFAEVEELTPTARGEGGLGSTGQ